MKKTVLAVAIVAFILSAAPVKAGETVFNQASKCVESWKAPCCLKSEGKVTAPAQAKENKPVSRQTWTSNVLGNKIPAETMAGGKI